MTVFRNSRPFQAYLRGDLASTRHNAEGYAAWRARVPWTDEQIAAALDTLAAEFEANAAGDPSVHDGTWLAARYRNYANFLRRTGKLVGQTLATALSVLVKTCGVCALDGIERVALYRTGYAGRCKQHRMVPDAFVAGRLREVARGYAQRERDRAEFDTQDLARRSQHQTAIANSKWRKRRR